MNGISPATRRRYILQSVSIFGVLIAIGIGAYMWFNRGPSEDEVAAWVKTDIQNYLWNDPTYGKYQPRVTDVSLIKKTDVEYAGIAKVRAGYSGTDHNVAITVTYNGDKGMWEAERGAFLFLILSDMPGSETTTTRATAPTTQSADGVGPQSAQQPGDPCPYLHATMFDVVAAKTMTCNHSPGGGLAWMYGGPA